MNQKLLSAISDCGKADALMYAFEKAFLCEAFQGDDMAMRDRAESAFYAVWDMIRNVQADLDDLSKAFAQK